MKKRSNIAPIAIFFAVMLVIHFLSSLLFNLFPFPIKPTIVHIPVIIAGIVLGKEKGAGIGLVFGLSSLIMNTIQPTVTSFVFSPFISGSILSAVIAIVPRVLIGYVAGLIYELLKGKNETIAMIVGSFLGAMTNTILVLGGIYVIFGSQYASAIGQDFSALLPYLLGIITTNGIVEAIVGTIIAVMVSRILIKMN